MEPILEQIEISTDKSKLQLDVITAFLGRSYWANQRSVTRIQKSIDNSICYGVYLAGRQIAFARVVTDGATMYWLCDVFIDEEYRGQSIGKRLVETIVTSEELKDLMGLLGTADAHGLYEQFDFDREPERFMRRTPDYVRRLAAAATTNNPPA